MGAEQRLRRHVGTRPRELTDNAFYRPSTIRMNAADEQFARTQHRRSYRIEFIRKCMVTMQTESDQLYLSIQGFS